MRRLGFLRPMFGNDGPVVTHWVRWYVRDKLSYRDLVEMMAERGLSMAHTTIMRWVVPVFQQRWRKYAMPVSRADFTRTTLWRRL